MVFFTRIKLALVLLTETISYCSFTETTPELVVVAAGHKRRENNPDIQVVSSLSVYVQKDTPDPAGNPFIPFHPRKDDVLYTYTVGRTQGLLPQRVQFPQLISSKTIDQALLRCSKFLMSGTVPLAACGALTAMSAITLP